MSHPNYNAACAEMHVTSAFTIKRGNKDHYPPSKDTPEYRVCSNCAARSPQAGRYPQTYCLNPDSPFNDQVIDYSKTGCDQFIYGRQFTKQYRL